MEDDPIAQLERSHRRLEERLAELRGGDPDAVLDAIAWFERSVTRHEEDEERSLFPRLAGEPALERTLRTLAVEHVAHRELHEKLRALAEPWPGRAPTAEERAELTRLVAELDEAYRRHIALEERELFPAARRLEADELAGIAAEMAARRPRGGGGHGRGRRLY
jgi:hemerythrin-like domain-containing protein